MSITFCMNKLFFFLLSTLSTVAFGQIQAATSAGKKVILNMDKTWDWADPKDADDRPCNTNHTGTIVIHNKTSHDIYFYYTSHPNSLNVAYITVKSGKSKIMNDL